MSDLQTQPESGNAPAADAAASSAREPSATAPAVASTGDETVSEPSSGQAPTTSVDTAPSSSEPLAALITPAGPGEVAAAPVGEPEIGRAAEMPSPTAAMPAAVVADTAVGGDAPSGTSAPVAEGIAEPATNENAPPLAPAQPVQPSIVDKLEALPADGAAFVHELLAHIEHGFEQVSLAHGMSVLKDLRAIVAKL